MLRTGVQAKRCGGFEEGGSGTGDRGACHDVGFMAGGMAGAEDDGVTWREGGRCRLSPCGLLYLYCRCRSGR